MHEFDEVSGPVTLGYGVSRFIVDSSEQMAILRVHPIPLPAARADRVAPAEHIAARGLGLRAKADVFELFE